MVAMRKMVMPSLYLQGKGAIYYLGQKALPLGDKAHVIGGATALEVAGERIRKSLSSNGIEIVGWNDTVKECTHNTINRLVDEGKHLRAHFVVGVGGGRAMDTAKAVAWKLKLPAISIGTQCATNGDAAAESVVYTEDHRFLEVLMLPSNPVLVIEDTEIISKAPVKYIIWGMGDALSTKFEAEAYARAREKKKDGAVPPDTALALANACHRVLMEHGLKAVQDLRNGIHSHEVDEIIEAVKLSSAMAFENTGGALAHSLHNGLKKTGQVSGEHGEIVAYATIVQTVFERRPREEIRQLISWCDMLGLPTKLKALGDPSKAALRQAVEHACDRDRDSRNMPERMKHADVMNAIDMVERGGI
ncbi:MAG: glycerol dehydrogenase [Thermoplasmata archaeon]